MLKDDCVNRAAFCLKTKLFRNELLLTVRFHLKKNIKARISDPLEMCAVHLNYV